jgi:hypothetical protein
MRDCSSGIVAKGETSRGKFCFASVPLEKPDADLLLKGLYLKA